MLYHPRTPLAFASLALLGLAAFLALYHPSPGRLSLPHAAIPGLEVLSGCGSCHRAEGLAEGCLSCHREIGSQLTSKRGYHAFLLGDHDADCAPCHPEHIGRDFPLVSRLSYGGKGEESFDHPHVEFRLKGKHIGLGCGSCHGSGTGPRGNGAPFALAGFASLARPRTFLGASQECGRCHEDVHQGKFPGSCDQCHGQDSFRTVSSPSFDHSKFFPLIGPHAELACNACHGPPQASKDGAPALGKAAGKRCEDCHRSPHRSEWKIGCEGCHAPQSRAWAAASGTMTAELHAAAGFRLIAPHASVSCEKCHPPGVAFEKRYGDPRVAGKNREESRCESCHRDVHAGQFAKAHPACLDCHQKTSFRPALFGLKQHDSFALLGPHTAVPCGSCHRNDPGGVRRFAGTERRCQGCHPDPHGGQFARELRGGDCSECHLPQAPTFAIRPFPHAARTRYALEGAHARARCEGCHQKDAGKLLDPAGAPATRYRGTPQLCASCHRDVHRGQFIRDGGVRCESCHPSTESWKQVRFDHNRQSDFLLDGIHSRLSCAACHREVEVPGDGRIVLYRPLGKECKDCHEVKR
jgi:hypothetical protein